MSAIVSKCLWSIMGGILTYSMVSFLITIMEKGDQWRKKYQKLPDETVKHDRAEADFREIKTMSATGLNIANFLGLIWISADTVGIPMEQGDSVFFRLFLSALIQSFNVVLWSMIHWSSIACRAKHYGVFMGRRQERFLGIGFVAVIMSGPLLTIQALHEWYWLAPYFLFAGISAFVLSAWTIFKRPPREIVGGTC